MVKEVGRRVDRGTRLVEMIESDKLELDNAMMVVGNSSNPLENNVVDVECTSSSSNSFFEGEVVSFKGSVVNASVIPSLAIF